MAEKVLSQDEVDALMKGVSNGAIDTDPVEEEQTGEVRNFNLTSQDKVVRGRMPTMEIINERFIRLFRVSMFNLTRKVPDVTVEGLRMVKYGEFLKNIPLPASLNIFQVQPLRGLNLLVFDASLIFLLVDNYFGGGGKYHTRVEGRDFTSIENRIIRKLTDITFNDMQKSWKPVHEVEFVYNRSEVNPQFANIVVPTEVVIVATFKIDMDDKTSTMNLCYPYSNIEPIKEKLYATYQSDMMEVDRRWLKRFEEEILQTTVAVNCVMGRARISIEDFKNLEIGDVIQFNQKGPHLAEVNVEGVQKFKGSPGLSEGAYGVKLIDDYS
ncbi:MAG: flagellar motor switch protein FliM [Deltaproteobacteria bacterium]|nr:flagellar motor switch protein FliM [Deltaproteobacteria bacterium]